MTVTTSTIMSNSVVTQYDADFIENFHKKQVWASVIGQSQERKVPVGGGKKGKTIQIPIYEGLAAPTDHLTENLDVTPKTIDDTYVECTIYEEGDAIQSTALLDMVAYTDLHKVFADALSAQQAERQDNIIRDAVVFAQQRTIYGGGGTSRVDLNTTDDKLTFLKFVEAEAMALAQGIPPFEDGTFYTVMHPMAILDVMGWTNEWLYPAAYANPALFQTGKINEGGTLPGEVGKLSNIRIVRHQYGKVFLGAGAPTQAATSLSAATAAGATSITVPDATGLAVGNKITVGTIESSTTAYPTTEQCEITVVAGTTLTVKGAGNAFGNYGLKFAHDAGESVIEAPNVVALPILGPQSILIPRGEGFDIEGKATIEMASTVIPNRFINFAWWNVLGAALIPKFSLQIEAAMTGYIYGNA